MNLGAVRGEWLYLPSTAPWAGQSQSSNSRGPLRQTRPSGRVLSPKRAYSPLSTTLMSCPFLILSKKTASACWLWNCFPGGPFGAGSAVTGSPLRRRAQRYWLLLLACRPPTRKTSCTETSNPKTSCSRQRVS